MLNSPPLKLFQGGSLMKTKMKMQLMSAALTLSLISPVIGYSQEQGYTPKELVVKMKPNHPLPHLGAGISVQNLFGDIFVLRGNGLQKLKTQLQKNTDIESVDYSQKAEVSPLPKPFDVPLSEKAEGGNDIGGLFNDPQADQVWSFLDASMNGVSVETAYKEHGEEPASTITVAVVDTGIDLKHEDLQDILWKNTKEIPGNNVDDDNNGYVDDIYGINTLVRDAQGKATANNQDAHSHGTHVSGTIGAKQNNIKGIAGIASHVRMMGIRAVPNNGDETDVNVAEAFLYAAKNGARIINCSFGKNQNEGRNLIPDTLKYIHEKYDVLVVAAAGNDGYNIDSRPTYPASHPNDNLLIVASTDDDGELSGFSNFGKKNVDIAAPGSSILSTTPGNRYQSMSGTSMASPTAAGVAAQVLAHHPKLTALQLKDILMRSVTKHDTLTNRVASGGRIDLNKALILAKQLGH